MEIKTMTEEKLPLTNDGQLQLFFIGVGSAFAEEHFQTNLLIIKGDQHILVDFGATGQRALLETAGLKPVDIEYVLPTHSHADHIGGLECLALMNRYVGQRFMGKSKLKMIATPEYQRILWDYSLRGGLEWNEAEISSRYLRKGITSGNRMMYVVSDETTGQKLGLTDFFELITPDWKTNQPSEIWTADVGGIKLQLFRTKHIPEGDGGWADSFVSYGLFIDGKVFYSADTRFDPALIGQYAPDAEVMFQDVQFFPGAVHAPLEDLKGLPQKVKDKMYLVHYADNWRDQDIADFAGWTQQGVIYEF